MSVLNNLESFEKWYAHRQSCCMKTEIEN